ncbi:MAG: ABC transporter permease [Acidimicrobiales bacterium]
MSARTSTALQYAVGTALLLALWQVFGATAAFGQTVPSLASVLAALGNATERPILFPAVGATVLSALAGLAIGGGGALLAAAVRHSVQFAREGIDRSAATVHAIPAIGVAPVLALAVGRSTTPVALAALATFFPVYITASAALGAAQSAHQDVFSVLGASRLQRLRRLQLPAAVPGLLDALRLGAPGAVLGAVLGEWFGAPRGLGLVIISSAQNYQIVQMWAASLLTTLLSLVAFAGASALQIVTRRRFA